MNTATLRNNAGFVDAEDAIETLDTLGFGDETNISEIENAGRDDANENADTNDPKLDSYQKMVMSAAKAYEGMLDDNKAVKRHVDVGLKTIKACKERQTSYKDPSSYGKKDLEDVCSDIARRVKMVVATDLDSKKVAKDVRVALWVSVVEPTLGKDILKLPYGLIVNKLLKFVAIDPVKLTAKIKEDSRTFLLNTLQEEIKSRRSIEEIDSVIRDHEKSLAKQEPVKTAEQIADAEQRAKRKARSDAMTAIGTAIERAVVETKLSGDDIAQVLALQAKENNFTLPTVGFDAKDCTSDDAIRLAHAMRAFGKLDVMLALRDALDSMIQEATTPQPEAA